MGEHDVKQSADAVAKRRFTRQIIQDVLAMEHMLDAGMFETGIRRIGAEQELFLVDDRGQPAPVVEELLAKNTDPRLVTELTRFNLEINLAPAVFDGTCLSELESQINEVLVHARGLARQVDAHAIMAGILPTVHLSDLSLENMAPMPRYFALNDAIMGLRNGPAQYQIRGTDELFFQHDNILVEGCNTSFQLHLQVAPDEFAHLYNLAQLVAGPVLASATNSPTLFGKRLWRETRIALFQQAVDTRSSNLYLRDMSPRVHFGSGWLDKSVTEIYKEDIARFRVIMTSEFDDPFVALGEGRTPKLRALQLHNGTVYRWNRPCYGISPNGQPHLRIENRILPAGPSVVDEVANAAFWFGLVMGLAARIPDVRPLMEFDDAKTNFVAAARQGLASQMHWLDGRRLPAPQLIQEELLPIAREGLEAAGIRMADIDRYLTVIEQRVASGKTGSEWQLSSLARMRRKPCTRAERLNSLVAALMHRQQTDAPGHEWQLAQLEEGPVSSRLAGTRVEHYMSTDLYTVHEDEAVEFVAVLMDWQNIRHVIVEDRNHRVVGIVTHRRMLRYMAESAAAAGSRDITVRDIMHGDPVSVGPETSTMHAIRLMRDNAIGALPVVRENQLVGIITESDFARIANKILDDSLADDSSPPAP